MATVKFLVLPLVVALAFVGCAPPYYPELNVNAALTDQMKQVGTISGVSPDQGDQATSVRFLPTRPTATDLAGVSVTSGFVITTTAANENFAFFSASGGKASKASPSGGAQTSLSLAGADPHYPLYQYVVAATGPTANLVIVRLDPADPTTSWVELVQNARLSVPAMTSPNTNPETAPLVGASAFAREQADDSFSGLSLVPTPPPEFSTDIGVTIDGVVNVLNPGTNVSFPPLPSLNSFLYYYNPIAGTNYAQVFSSGKWVCYTWPDVPSTPASLPVLTGVVHRIDAILSTGDLLSTEGGTLRLYDPNGGKGAGAEVNAFDLGGLQFCYEAYIGSTPYVFFALPLTGKKSGEWIFQVFAVPTAGMRDLHN